MIKPNKFVPSNLSNLSPQMVPSAGDGELVIVVGKPSYSVANIRIWHKIRSSFHNRKQKHISESCAPPFIGGLLDNSSDGL